MVKHSGLPIMSATAQTDRQGGGTAILARRGIFHHSVPVPGLTHMEAIVFQVILAGRLVKIFVAYPLPSRPLIGADVTACFGGWLPVFFPSDLNLKYLDWNSRLNKRRG
jgi:hypothetical protein